jgi:hypothetical protein
MYIKKAVRLTFSLSGLAPTSSAAIRYQIDTCAETLICCDECPIAHQMTRYISGSMSAIRPSDHSQVGIRMIAPDAMVNTAMIAAVSAPNVTSGIEPSYVPSSLATTSVAKKTEQPINAPTANRISDK